METIWALIDEDLEVPTGLAATEMHRYAYSLLCQDMTAGSNELASAPVGREGGHSASATTPSEAGGGVTPAVECAKHSRDDAISESHVRSLAAIEVSQPSRLDDCDDRGRRGGPSVTVAAEGPPRCAAAMQNPTLRAAECDASRHSLHEQGSCDGKELHDQYDVGLPPVAGVGYASDVTLTHSTCPGTMSQRMKAMAWSLVLLTEAWVRFSGLTKAGTLDTYPRHNSRALETTLAPHLINGRLRWNRKHQGFYCRVTEQAQLEAEINAICARQDCQAMPT